MINRGLIILIGWLLFLTACNQQESSSIKDFYPSIHAEELILKKDYESFQEMLSDSSKQDINETDFRKLEERVSKNINEHPGSSILRFEVIDYHGGDLLLIMFIEEKGKPKITDIKIIPGDQKDELLNWLR